MVSSAPAACTVIHGHATAQDDQRCHGTDDDGIHKYFKDSEEALLYRFLRISTGMGDGSGTKTGLVGEDASGYALFHAHEEASDRTAGDSRRDGKHLSIIAANTAGTRLDMDHNHAQCQQDIHDRHETVPALL